MDPNPLVTEKTDAGAELIEKLRQSVRVEAAFWLNPSEDGRWALYVASPEIDDGNFDHPYGTAIRIARSLNTPYIDPYQIRFIGVGDPLARAAVAINQKYPGRLATRFHGESFGGFPIEEVYVYPNPPVPAAR